MKTRRKDLIPYVMPLFSISLINLSFLLDNFAIARWVALVVLLLHMAILLFKLFRGAPEYWETKE
jgi:hypothetical protein